MTVAILGFDSRAVIPPCERGRPLRKSILDGIALSVVAKIEFHCGELFPCVGHAMPNWVLALVEFGDTRVAVREVFTRYRNLSESKVASPWVT